MKYIVTKLKRYKVLIRIISIIALPLTLPLFIIYKIGELAELCLDLVNDICYKILEKLVKILKFDEVASKQYEINKDKFKEF